MGLRFCGELSVKPESVDEPTDQSPDAPGPSRRRACHVRSDDKLRRQGWPGQKRGLDQRSGDRAAASGPAISVSTVVAVQRDLPVQLTTTGTDAGGQRRRAPAEHQPGLRCM